ncbi:hydrogenase expression protein HypE [Pseudoroseomonas cervicalis]|uniref:hydrogenase large subunit n=1 Tax=Teichococcus cervicalis TaxID=204525 RepID=UPI0027837899|nr:hydrogenase expression protein HypE [Pseudoroseomonas cervicalis]MDQ1080147.1 Ni,Fe-hydrogenase III large subunit [Pseudoroseomonas cervicalis]
MTGPATRLILAGRPRAAFHHHLDAAAWAALPAALRQEPELELLGLWPGEGMVHAAFRAPGAAAPLLAGVAVEGGAYAALSPARPGAEWFERMIADLTGWSALGATDARPFLDHGRWAMRAPLSAAPPPRSGAVPQPEFRVVAGEGVHQIPLGPIQGGIGEPAHLRLHVRGETVLRMEALLGYAHRGVLALLRGRALEQAAPLLARLAGDSTVAQSWAFALAAERALGIAAPARAAALRGVMAELERIANHLHDIGGICAEAGFAWPQSRCGALREAVLRAAGAGFGHRLMMDGIVPGGVARDLSPEGAARIAEAMALLRGELPPIRRIVERHAGLQERLSGCGTVRPELTAALGAAGLPGRAAGRALDARADYPYAPYDQLGLVPALRAEGDAAARLALRFDEIAQSQALVAALLGALPAGALRQALPPLGEGSAEGGAEGLGVVEGFRGEVLCWLSLDAMGRIRAAFPRDPSWLHWRLLEAAMEGREVGDAALCRASLNPSVAGVDL